MGNKTLVSGLAIANWDDPSVWTPTGVPLSTDTVTIQNANITVNGNDAVSGAFYTAPGDTLTVGPGATLSGTVFLDAGTLDLQGTLGTLATLGSVVHADGGTLISSGGTLSNLTVSGSLSLAAGNPVVSLDGNSGIEGTLFANVDGATVQVGAASPSGAFLSEGLILLGAPDAGAPASLKGVSGALSLFGTTVDVTGAAQFDGTVSLENGPVIVAPGGSLAIDGTLRGIANAPGFVGSGSTFDIDSGTLDLSNATLSISFGQLAIRMDDGAGTLILGAQQSVTVSNFQAGDTVDIKGATAAGALVAAGNVLSVGTDHITLDAVAAGQTFSAVSDGTGGTLVTTNRVPPLSPQSFAISGANASVEPSVSGAPPTFTFTVTRSGDTGNATVIGYSVAGTGASAGSAVDIEAADLAGTLTFRPGDSSQTITLYTQDTASLVTDQTFAVTLSAPADTSVTTASAAGTILHDDAASTLTTGAGTSLSIGGNTITSPNANLLGFSDGTLGTEGGITMDPAAAGGPSYLQYQYIYAGSDNIAFATQAPNVFIHGGSGNDAIQVTSGQNVLDGGLGSNFLTGGSGTDTFFTDARAPGVVWNTLVNFHAGDAATLWGFVPGVSSFTWDSTPSGAAGAQGATLRANIVGGAGRTGDGVDASITFAGLSVAQAQKLEIVTGSVAAGSYLYVYNPGV